MNKNLPIGTIVILNNSNVTVMISGLYIKKEKKVFEYLGVVYPEGCIVEETLLYFNGEDISKVIFLGNINYKKDR